MSYVSKKMSIFVQQYPAIINQKLSMSKISFRFYKDQEVRAVWKEEENKWFFSVVDIVAAITESPNPRKYWSVLKTRLKKSGNELTTICSQLKLTASDGKKYNTDCFPQDAIKELVKVIPSKNAMEFLDWLTYSENTLDGKSKQRAYELWESGILNSIEVGTTKGLQQIHAYIFGGLYDFAGQIRNATISKGDTIFCRAEYLHYNLEQIEKMPEGTFNEIVDKYVEMNVAHPFMEGNGRSTRIWLDLILKERLNKCVDWSKINKNDYLQAMTQSLADSTQIKHLLTDALTDNTNDRELFMKGIDYSYYYEQED